MVDRSATERQPFAERQALKDLMVFHDVARSLASSLDLDSILGAIMEQMKQYFEPESWSLLIVDAEQGNLYYAVAAGKAAAHRGDRRVPMGKGIAGWVAEHGAPLILPEGPDDSRIQEMEASYAPSAVRSAICIPLVWQQQTLGVIELLNYRVASLTDYTITFLHVLCDYAAIAIQNLRAVERIQELTITDDCTGLYNSRHLFSVMEKELERAHRFRIPCSAIFIDLDHFKRINDAHGHLVGSGVLAEVARTFRQNIRAVDWAFRYGGDEFVILLPQTGKDAAFEVARRLLIAVRSARYQAAAGLELAIQASFGVATYPEDGASARNIIEAADETMYLVKNRSRGGIAIAGRGCVSRARIG